MVFVCWKCLKYRFESLKSKFETQILNFLAKKEEKPLLLTIFCTIAFYTMWIKLPRTTDQDTTDRGGPSTYRGPRYHGSSYRGTIKIVTLPPKSSLDPKNLTLPQKSNLTRKISLAKIESDPKTAYDSNNLTRRKNGMSSY